MSAEELNGSKENHDDSSSVNYAALYEEAQTGLVKDPGQAEAMAHAMKESTEHAQAAENYSKAITEAVVSGAEPDKVADLQNEASKGQLVAAHLDMAAEAQAQAAGDAYITSQLEPGVARVEDVGTARAMADASKFDYEQAAGREVMASQQVAEGHTETAAFFREPIAADKALGDKKAEQARENYLKTIDGQILDPAMAQEVAAAAKPQYDEAAAQRANGQGFEAAKAQHAGDVDAAIAEVLQQDTH